MGFNCGIVGLPNVGKSTLFNALTATAAAEAANYPFCTIEPNIGRVAVPDDRLETIARLAKSVRIVPTALEFVDIAGLVRGASKGEGLGNRFLGNIRAVDAIAHVVRCFDGGGVHHVEGTVDPLRDIDTVVYVRRRCDEPRSQLACGDDTRCEGGFPFGGDCMDGVRLGLSRVELDLEPGTYYVVVDAFLYEREGRESVCGNVELRVREAG